jgi:hypothetical protein
VALLTGRLSALNSAPVELTDDISRIPTQDPHAI